MRVGQRGGVSILAAALAVFATPTQAADRPWSLWGRLDVGAYEVGFRVIEFRDVSRKQTFTEGRPIQIGVWYPVPRPKAVAAPPPVMKYSDYVRVNASETTLHAAAREDERATLEGYRGFLGRNGIATAAANAWLGTEMAAQKDAAPAPGRFPLVVIAQGMGGAVQDQALLGEYLASHGWVAATSPSQARLGDIIKEIPEVFHSADQQARDMAIILRHLATFPAADTHRLAVIGYSFGARSALLFASREPSVNAFVSVDGGIAAREGREWLKGHPIKAKDLRVPVLHFFEDVDESVAPDFSLLASLRVSDRLLLKVDGMKHLDFTTLGMARALVAGVSGGPVPDRGLEDRFMSVVKYTRAFLDAHVEGSEADMAFLARDPAANDFGSTLTRVIRMPARR